MKIGNVEIGSQEIEVLLRGAGAVLNSRIGLAVLVWLAFTCSLGGAINEIGRDTAQMVEALRDTRQNVQANNSMLVRLVERCKLDPFDPPSRHE